MEPEFSALAGALCQDSLQCLLPCGPIQWVKGSGFPLEDWEPFLLVVGLVCIFQECPVCPCAGVSQDFMVSPWASLLWLLCLPCPLPCVTVTPLTRMIDWVSWPLGKNIDRWIIALLKGLAAVKKFSILIEVSLAKIEKVGAPCPNLGWYLLGAVQVWGAGSWGHCVTGLIRSSSLGLKS